MIENTPSSLVPATDDPSADYLIRVRGWLDPNWFEFHQELSITATAVPDQVPETSLRGRVADQSALIGILSTLHHFGLVLILVQLVEPESALLEERAAVAPQLQEGELRQNAVEGKIQNTL